MKNREIGSNEEKSGLYIPDDQVGEWMQVYREIGLGEQEIEQIMVQLNDTYAKLKNYNKTKELARSKFPNLSEERFERMWNALAKQLGIDDDPKKN